MYHLIRYLEKYTVYNSTADLWATTNGDTWQEAIQLYQRATFTPSPSSNTKVKDNYWYNERIPYPVLASFPNLEDFVKHYPEKFI